MFAQSTSAGRVIGVVAHQGSRFAVSAEVFARIEAEAGNLAECPDRFSFEERAVGLRGVFHNRQSVLASHGNDRIEIGWVPVEVNGQDSLGAAGDSSFNFRRIKVESLRIDVHINRPRPHVRNCPTGCHEGERSRDHFIPWTDSQQHQRQMKG